MKLRFDLEGMRAFVAIAETSSLTSAAMQLSTSKSTISRRLDAYETAIGASLFRRSTRALSLTDIGQRHYDKVKDLIADAESAVDEIAGSNATPSGLIRLSGSFTGGQRLLMPFVWKFMEKYPNIKVEMRFSDDLVDIISEGIDFTLRMGELADSELLIRRLGQGVRVIVASPKLIARHFEPNSVNELRRLPAIVTAADRTVWRFQSGESISVNWHMCAGAIPVAVEAALRGVGIALVPLNYCQHFLEDGRLLQLLPAHPLPRVDISLVYPRLRHQSPAAKAFLQEIRLPENQNMFPR